MLLFSEGTPLESSGEIIPQQHWTSHVAGTEAPLLDWAQALSSRPRQRVPAGKPQSGSASALGVVKPADFGEKILDKIRSYEKKLKFRPVSMG
jgi:hypothetical protein